MDFHYSTLILVLLFCVLGGFAAGYFGHTLFSWGMRREMLDLDYRLSDLEGRVSREVKIRAAEKSNRSQSLDKEIIALATQGEPTKNETDLHSWRQKMFLRK